MIDTVSNDVPLSKPGFSLVEHSDMRPKYKDVSSLLTQLLKRAQRVSSNLWSVAEEPWRIESTLADYRRWLDRKMSRWQSQRNITGDGRLTIDEAEIDRVGGYNETILPEGAQMMTHNRSHISGKEAVSPEQAVAYLKTEMNHHLSAWRAVFKTAEYLGGI